MLSYNCCVLLLLLLLLGGGEKNSGSSCPGDGTRSSAGGGTGELQNLLLKGLYEKTNNGDNTNTTLREEGQAKQLDTYSNEKPKLANTQHPPTYTHTIHTCGADSAPPLSTASISASLMMGRPNMAPPTIWLKSNAPGLWMWRLGPSSFFAACRVTCHAMPCHAVQRGWVESGLQQWITCFKKTHNHPVTAANDQKTTTTTTNTQTHTYLLMLLEKSPLSQELDHGLVLLLPGRQKVGAGHEGAGHGVLEARLLHLFLVSYDVSKNKN